MFLVLDPSLLKEEKIKNEYERERKSKKERNKTSRTIT